MIEGNMEIIIPTYNREKCLDNLLSQFANSPFLNYKITVIDNASEDNTLGICEKYKEIFPNLIIFRNNKNIGLSANLLRCFETATSEYMWLVGDNDYYDFSDCSDLIEALESSKFDLIFIQRFGKLDNLDLKETTIKKLADEGYTNNVIRLFATVSIYIFKSELFTSEDIQKGYDMARDLYPQLVLAKKAFEENFSIYFTNNLRTPGMNPHVSYNTLSLVRGWINANLVFNNKKLSYEGTKYFLDNKILLYSIVGGIIVGKAKKVDNYRREVNDLIIATWRVKGLFIGFFYAIIVLIVSLTPHKIAYHYYYNIYLKNLEGGD